MSPASYQTAPPRPRILTATWRAGQYDNANGMPHGGNDFID
jgi:hypothetical protein